MHTAQLELPTNVRAIKGLDVCISWDLRVHGPAKRSGPRFLSNVLWGTTRNNVLSFKNVHPYSSIELSFHYFLHILLYKFGSMYWRISLTGGPIKLWFAMKLLMYHIQCHIYLGEDNSTTSQKKRKRGRGINFSKGFVAFRLNVFFLSISLSNNICNNFFRHFPWLWDW